MEPFARTLKSTLIERSIFSLEPAQLNSAQELSCRAHNQKAQEDAVSNISVCGAIEGDSMYYQLFRPL